MIWVSLEAVDRTGKYRDTGFTRKGWLYVNHGRAFAPGQFSVLPTRESPFLHSSQESFKATLATVRSVSATNCGNINKTEFVILHGDPFDDWAISFFINSHSFTTAQTHTHTKNPFWQESSSVSYIYRVRLVHTTARLIPTTEAAIHSAWSSLPFQLGRCSAAHIPLAAKLTLGPVQDPTAPAYHTAS